MLYSFMLMLVIQKLRIFLAYLEFYFLSQQEKNYCIAIIVIY